MELQTGKDYAVLTIEPGDAIQIQFNQEVIMTLATLPLSTGDVVLSVYLPRPGGLFKDARRNDLVIANRFAGVKQIEVDGFNLEVVDL